MNSQQEQGHIELILDAPAAWEELLALLLFEQGAAGVEIDDPAAILGHLARGDWDASVFDQQPPEAGRVRLRALFPHDAAGERALKAVAAALPADEDIILHSGLLPAQDWQAEWKRHFPAQELGSRLWLAPYWQERSAPAQRIPLIVDPGLVFGTGQHATTAMMLELIEEYIQPGGQALDLGCGSGILGIAALKLGAERAVGVDIDPDCGPAIARHLAINHLDAGRYTFHLGDVLADEKLMRRLRREKSQLALANINGAIVRDLTLVAGRFLQHGGYFLCSGILAEQGGVIAKALAYAGMAVLAMRERDGWAAFAATPVSE